MKNIIIDQDVECTSCYGTGLYKGCAEKDKAAVICNICNGTGKQHIHYEFNKFEKRKINRDVERVYKTSGGYCITTKDINGIMFSKAGIEYNEWLNGKEPRPIKDLHCPLIHYEQGSEIGRKIKDTFCVCKMGMLFSECAKENRADCWIKFDNIIGEEYDR
jgi:hypothetical protein